MRKLGDLEGDAAIVVLFSRCIEVEVSERHLVGVAGGEVEERGSYDRVVSDFEFVAIFEYEDGWLASGLGHGWIVLRIVCDSVRRSRSLRRNVGVGARSAAVKNCWASLVVGVIRGGVGIVVRLILRGAEIDGVGDREGIEHWAVAGVMVMVAVAVSWVRSRG